MSKEKTIAALQGITDAKPSMVKNVKSIFNEKLTGSIKGDSFHLSSYESPPSELKGTIKSEDIGTVIDIRVIDNAPPNTGLYLLYGLGYPIFAVFFIWQLIVDPTSILLWVIGVIVLVVFLAVGKLLKWLHDTPYPMRSIELIQRQVNGKLS